MGKIKKIVCLVMICALSMVMLAGCSPQSKFDKLIKNLDAKDASYDIKMTMTTPFGEMVINSKVDGNKRWMSSLMGSGETYYEVIDGKEYEYKQSNGVWTKTISTTSNDDDELDATEFDSSEFDYKDKKFILKKEHLSKYDVESMTIELTDNNKGMIVDMTQNVEGMILSGKMEIYNYGDVTIELPNVK